MICCKIQKKNSSIFLFDHADYSLDLNQAVIHYIFTNALSIVQFEEILL